MSLRAEKTDMARQLSLHGALVNQRYSYKLARDHDESMLLQGSSCHREETSVGTAQGHLEIYRFSMRNESMLALRGRTVFLKSPFTKQIRD